jgi:hypothetical protein
MSSNTRSRVSKPAEWRVLGLTKQMNLKKKPNKLKASLRGLSVDYSCTALVKLRPSHTAPSKPSAEGDGPDLSSEFIPYHKNNSSTAQNSMQSTSLIHNI